MNNIADYDTLDYDYSVYWKKREYENGAEHILLNKVFKEKKGSWFIDIGGSFGRLTDTYYNQYTNPIILDYSLKTLQKNRELLLKKYPNIELIAANAYKLPFKDEIFDGGVMVRVLHHIDNPQVYFKEIHRVLNGQSIYLQEFANKIHIKARVKAILTLNFPLFNKEPYQQPDKKNNEGARENSKVPFLNYHPSWMKYQLNKQGLIVQKKYGCSFLRMRFLKKILSPKVLLSFERFLQDTLSWSNIPPSVFFQTTKLTHVKNNSNMKLNSILSCPSCHGDLTITGSKATCTKCKKTFVKEKDIWDFRI